MLIIAYTLALGMPGLPQWIIIGALGQIIFGKRLPEVGRSLGKGIVEFKKGLKGVEEEISQVDQQPAPQPRVQATLPSETKVQQYDPYTGKPLAPSTEQQSTHA